MKKFEMNQKKIAQCFLNELPAHFTMMHLEVLKVTFQEEVEKKISDLKLKTKLR